MHYDQHIIYYLILLALNCKYFNPTNVARDLFKKRYQPQTYEQLLYKELVIDRWEITDILYYFAKMKPISSVNSMLQVNTDITNL